MTSKAAHRHTQHATRAAFFIAGCSLAVWAPLVPYAQVRASLNEAQLGLLLLCLGVGSLLGMPLAGLLAARFGCRKVFTWAAITLCASLPILGSTDSSWVLGITLFIFGAALGAADCAASIQSVIVEKASGRALMSGFHALFSFGCIVGVVAVSALLSVGLTPFWAALIVALTIVVLLTFTSPHLLGHTRDDRGGPLIAIPHGIVLLLGGVCCIAFLTEGAMLDWSAIYLNQHKQMLTAQAGLGYAAFVTMMAVGRFAGDWLVRRAGLVWLLAGGATFAALALMFATFTASWQLALIGYALAGLGSANIVPIMYSLVGKQNTMPEALAVPALTTVGYSGILIGPAMMGFVAHSTGLTTAFLLVAGLLLLVALVSPALARAVTHS